MPRIIIIGSSCAGKTTMAQQLSAALGIKHIQLDAINWLPDWVERDHDETNDLLAKAVTENEHWVIDGNYSRTHHISLPLADAVRSRHHCSNTSDCRHRSVT